MNRASDETQRERVMQAVLDAMHLSNQTRGSEEQLAVHAQADIFGGDSPLDSLGLVALLLDIEDGLADAGLGVSLNSEDAMSRQHTPFRNVSTLVDYIMAQLSREAPLPDGGATLP